MSIELINLFPNLKSPSSNLREGSFSSIKKYLHSYKLDSEEQVACLSILCSKDYLFWKINEGQNDESVGRSFSLLTMCLILENDKDSLVDTNLLIDEINRYIKIENDFRGQTLELGWIHCWAHLGDLIAFLGYHENSSHKKLKSLLMNLVDKLSEVNDYKFSNEEEERLAYGINLTLKKLDFRKEFMEYVETITQSNLLTSVVRSLPL